MIRDFDVVIERDAEGYYPKAEDAHIIPQIGPVKEVGVLGNGHISQGFTQVSRTYLARSAA